MKLKFKKLHPDAVVPKYGTPGSSGFDLVAIEDVEIDAGETKLVKTGLSMAVELGYEIQVRPRSGLSLKTPLRVSNAPGTVDSDYRGEVCVIMTNTSGIKSVVQKRGYDGDLIDITLNPLEIVRIKKGDRIAQGVVCPIIQVDFEEVDDLDETARGSGAFGSTGKN